MADKTTDVQAESEPAALDVVEAEKPKPTQGYDQETGAFHV